MNHEKMVADLLAQALQVSKQAHAPYSRFCVGASLLAKSGQVYHGCNVENASFGLTMCAERNALYQAIANGEREFLMLAINGSGNKPILPCGACRQVLSEFCRDLAIVCTSEMGQEMIDTSLDRLLPSAFEINITEEDE